MAQQAAVGHQDTLAVPPMPKHVGLNEDLVKILRENLLQQERPRGHRRSPSSISPRLSPRNSPRLLRRMLLNNNIHKQRRFTVAHTCTAVKHQLCSKSTGFSSKFQDN
ncbi:hypothetical protein Q8A67_009803 [Cirrhinus molitorella]|uniref:Uncharacterized protein n=1 Tax=Cirrhinus molitorella TaxID=172907 RepID=A0AA88PNN1_9TELE|nr:hypothetical protein Q8A67_009803 [Cirrhinus molitorella]